MCHIFSPLMAYISLFVLCCRESCQIIGKTDGVIWIMWKVYTTDGERVDDNDCKKDYENLILILTWWDRLCCYACLLFIQGPSC